jgi:hypothetical protein
MKKPMILVIALGCCVLGATARAQTATNLDCTGCVGETDLANNAVTSGKIVNGTIATVDIKPSAVTTDKIKNGTIALADLSTDLKGDINNAIANLTKAQVLASAVGAVGAECPSNRIAVAASCECDDSGGSRNLGVLFTCAVSGTGVVAGCFDDAMTFNPQLGGPVAIVRAICLGAESTDGTPWVPTGAGLMVDAAGLDAAAVADQARWMKEQHATFEAALAKLKGQRALHEARRVAAK